MNFDEFEFCGKHYIGLKALTGSHNYNLNSVNSDRDYKFFVFPSFDDLYNSTMFSNSVQSTELDATCQDIRQLVSLISKGNINFIEVLFSRDHVGFSCFDWMFEEREKFASMNLFGFYKACWGMHLEKMSTLHKGTATTMPLVEKYGYDTKQACHALRCLFSISRYMETENMQQTLWFTDESVHRRTLMSVKNNELPEKDFVNLVNAWKNNWFENAETFYKSKPFNQALFDKAQAEVRNSVRQFMIN